MKINDLIKQIRVQKGYSLSAFGEFLGFSRGFLHNVESGERRVSKKLLEELIKKFPLYSKQLLKAYVSEKVPEIASEVMKEGTKIKMAEIREIVNELKVYTFDSAGDGKVNLGNYKKMKFPLVEEVKDKIMKNGYVFEITGDSMQPYFSSNDVIVLTKENFENWQSLDSRLILVEKKGEYFIRKLFFIAGEPYLRSFNERLFPEFKVDEDTKFIAILYVQLVRHVDKLQFMGELS
jgi:phage repressor protein C with HTH and peptisase S24 domain